MGTHGLSGYVIRKCRCDACRAAWAACMRKYRQRGRARRLASPGTLRHGTVNAYSNWGCRCELCKVASSIQAARLRGRRKLAAGLPLSPLERQVAEDDAEELAMANGNGKH